MTSPSHLRPLCGACLQVDDFDLERGDVSSGRWSSNAEGRPASLFDGSKASTHQGDGTSNGTQQAYNVTAALQNCKEELLKCKQSSRCP